VSANLDIIWVCGNAVAPSNASNLASAATTVPASYLPTSCHT
jgi:hypothetical protein